MMQTPIVVSTFRIDKWKYYDTHVIDWVAPDGYEHPNETFRRILLELLGKPDGTVVQGGMVAVTTHGYDKGPGFPLICLIPITC